MPERLRILIVDDNPNDREAVISALQQESRTIDGIDAEILELESIGEVRQALKSEEFACVFLGHHLPDGNSLDLLAELRKQGLATPIVVLTGERDEKLIIEVMKAGAVDYLPKDRLHPDLIARSLRAALRFLEGQRAKQAVLDELRALDRAISSASNGIVLTDPRQEDCPIVHANAAFLQMTGYSEEEVIGRNCRFLQGPETDAAVVKAIRNAVANGQACQVSILNYRKDGSTFWNAVTVSPVWDSQGALTHFVGILTDITEAHNAENERTRLAGDIRRLLDSSADGIYGLDVEGRITFANRSCLDMLGYTMDEIMGQGSHALFHSKHADGSPYPIDECPIQRALKIGEVAPRFENEVYWRKDGSSFPISYITAPIIEHGKVMGTVVTFSDISERKELEASRAKIAEREHIIAESLQAALQPDLPSYVPGMALRKYYQGAMFEEAEVGGDFYDAFTVSENCSILVVGDISGKGLQAAVNVSVVRNMLRAFVYSLSSLSRAVTELNKVLTANSLFDGFATLFAAAFDADSQELRYVNAGQEPALVLTNSNRVIELCPTGPIIGSILNAKFEEKSVKLAPGQAIAIFSDGLTEVGPSRNQMLGIEGVTDLILGIDLSACQGRAGRTAEKLMTQIIHGMEQTTDQKAIRDDICLLVGVVE